MKIAIIGHGQVGGALAKSWAAQGHTVFIGAKAPASEKAQQLTVLDNITALCFFGILPESLPVD